MLRSGNLCSGGLPAREAPAAWPDQAQAAHHHNQGFSNGHNYSHNHNFHHPLAKELHGSSGAGYEAADDDEDDSLSDEDDEASAEFIRKAMAFREQLGTKAPGKHPPAHWLDADEWSDHDDPRPNVWGASEMSPALSPSPEWTPLKKPPVPSLVLDAQPEAHHHRIPGRGPAPDLRPPTSSGAPPASLGRAGIAAVERPHRLGSDEDLRTSELEDEDPREEDAPVARYPQQQQTHEREQLEQQQPPSPTSCFWGQLRNKFMRSKWIGQAARIIEPRAARAPPPRPRCAASLFYEAVSEEFIASQDAEPPLQDVELFLERVQGRLGELWDPRLGCLVRVFWCSARAASRIVGLGRFAGIAQHLQSRAASSRDLVNSAIDQLLGQWERAMTLREACPSADPPLAGEPAADQARDAELEAGSDASASDEGSSGSCRDDSSVGDSDFGSSEEFDEEDPFAEEEEEEESAATEAAAAAGKNRASSAQTTGRCPLASAAAPDRAPLRKPQLGEWRRGGSCPGAQDAEARVNLTLGRGQRLPKACQLRLIRESCAARWFEAVDEVLLHNCVMKLMASVRRPAEHFFLTCVRLADENPGASLPQFQALLKARMGGAWDERLESQGLVRQFFQHSAAVRAARHQ